MKLGTGSVRADFAEPAAAGLPRLRRPADTEAPAATAPDAVVVVPAGPAPASQSAPPARSDAGRLEVSRDRAAAPAPEEAGEELVASAPAPEGGGAMRIAKAPWLQPDETVLSGSAGGPGGAHRLTVRRAAELFAGERAQFVDAQPALAYVFGHVPGAVSVPADTPEDGIARRLARLNRDLPVVVYGRDAGRPEAGRVAECLIGAGFRDVAVLRRGWVGWTEAELPVARGHEQADD